MKKILCLIILFALLSLNVSEIKASEEMTTFCSDDVNLTNIINEVDLLPLHNLSDEHLEKGTIHTIYVNKTIHVRLRKVGCYGDAYFNVFGTYEIEFDGVKFSVISHNLDVEIDSFTAEWVVKLSKKHTYILNEDSVTVIIRFEFLQPSMFCPTGGGFESSAVTVVV